MTIVVPRRRVSEELLARLKERVSSETVMLENEPLSKRTTLRVGGPADLLVEPATEGDLSQVLRACAEHETKWMMLGRGSNLLVRDGGIRGVVISLHRGEFSRMEIHGERVRAGAGVRLRAVAVEAKRALLTGFEFMEGIPGNIGGALRMNAGAMGSAMFQVVESVRMMDRSGEVTERSAAEIPVEYRNCAMLKEWIALSAVMIGRNAPLGTIESKMSECSRKRWDSQPAAPSAGCIFKNCATVPTGRLVQEMGLKGTRIGGAMISDVHGNFIVNDQGARAKDILMLIELVKERAKAERSIDLQTEVQIVGEEADDI